MGRREQSFMIRYSANLCPHGLKDIHVSTVEREVSSHGDLDAQSSFVCVAEGSKSCQKIVVEGVTTTDFDQGNRRKVGFLLFELQGSSYLAIPASNLMGHLTCYVVRRRPKVLVPPPLVFSEVGLRLEMSDNLSGSF